MRKKSKPQKRKLRHDMSERNLTEMVRLWNTTGVMDISKILKVPPATLRAWAYQLRKKGVPLKRKKPGKAGILKRFSTKNTPR